jgi:Kef-type K+ transport system membrane component KefB
VRHGRRDPTAPSVSSPHKLDGLAFGLLIPIFLVTSGMGIDPAAVAAKPLVLIAFVATIVVVRGGPILVATMTERRPTGPGGGSHAGTVCGWRSTGRRACRSSWR